MKPFFEKREKVRIRKDLREFANTHRIPFGFSSEMFMLAGRECLIKSVIENNYEPELFPEVMCDGCNYSIDIDTQNWSWSSPMFERVTSEIDSKLKLARKHNIILNFKN